MRQYLRLTGPFLVMLAFVTAGRLYKSFKGVPYAEGTHIFSIVVLTIASALYYGAFVRRWRGFTVLQAALMGVTLAVCAQLVIMAATAGSYAFGVETYFNFPRALGAEAPVGFGEAMLGRVAGLVFNSLFSGILAGVGWALGGLLPEK